MKRSVFLFWLYSNLAILCVPIIITMAVLLRSQNLLTSEVTRSNEAMLIQLKQSLDDQLKDLKRMGLQLSLEPSVLDYLSLTDYTTVQSRMDTLDLISTLRSYSASNGDITNLYIYLKNPRFGVTTSAKNDADTLFSLYHAGGGVSYEAWKESLNRTYLGSFFMLTNRDLVYMQSLPIQDGAEARATLTVLMNTDRLKTAISNIQLAQSGSVLLVGADNQIIMSVGNDAVKPDYTRLVSDRGSFMEGDNTVSYVASGENDWKYVSIVPTKVYAAKVTQLQSWIYGSLLLCLFIGGGMSVWLTRKNYMPIRRMVDLVSPKVKSNLSTIGNEFSLLHSFMTENAASIDSANRTIERQHFALRKHFLSRLLKGRVESGSALSQALESFELHFETNRFAVLLFHIGDYEALFGGREQRDAEAKFQYVQYIVENIAGELLGQKHLVYSTEVDGMVAFLLNVRGGEDQAAKQDMLEAAQHAQHVIQTKFYVQLTIGISDIHPTAAGIPHGFEEALEALEYKFVIGPSQIIPFERIKRPKSELFYPLDTERQLINHIKTGQYEEASETVSGLILTNVSDGTLSLQLGKLLMFELIGTILKAIEHIQQGDELAVEKTELIKQLTNCESFAEMENEIYQFLKLVCDYIHSKKKSHNTNLKDHVLAYINEHLSDMNLSLTSLSLDFGLNAPYLSRFFKEQTGETFIDYVNLQRVGMAKRLLSETDETINDITQQVGFTNSNTFIRVFKRYEGITPGQFRKGE